MRTTHALVLVALAGACGGTSPSNPVDAGDPNARAKAHFWSVFGAGQLDEVPAARAELVAGFQVNPDAESARLIGMSYQLQIAEAARDAGAPSTGGFAALAALGQAALPYLQQAVQLATPQSQQTWNSSFLAGGLYLQGFVRQDESTLEQARGLMDTVAQQFPAFGSLARGDVMRVAPAGTPDFTTDLDSYFHFFEDCIGQPLDRSHPDVSAVVTRAPVDPDPACGDSPKVPHAMQGMLFNFADVLERNGQKSAARGVLEVIPQTDGYATWSFQGLVSQRLSSDPSAPDGGASGMDGGTTRAFAGLSCLGCHQD